MTMKLLFVKVNLHLDLSHFQIFFTHDLFFDHSSSLFYDRTGPICKPDINSKMNEINEKVDRRYVTLNRLVIFVII